MGPNSNSFNGITWWAGISGKDDFPALFKYVLDTLSCLAISTERERVFSSIKKLITPPEKPARGGYYRDLRMPEGVAEKNSLIEQQFRYFKKQKK